MKIKKGFTLRTVMGQNIVLAEGNNSDSYGKIIKLNESAAMLWDGLRGKSFDVEYAAGLLTKNYGIDRERALSDAAYIIGLMDEKGLIDNSH